MFFELQRANNLRINVESGTKPHRLVQPPILNYKPPTDVADIVSYSVRHHGELFLGEEPFDGY